ncbi:WD40 repeat domain-containing protein [Stenotrophomonas mori]|uniref:WD40 repeat domain-containing protein n=1 Tax=Stenotrophomonas mori TaxID=2871096 RepID=A0ABT0SJ22_9GAMM|nr:hypothetical protein [Stenotrophomonas mori]MCL7715314.1 hypothetical protein [Stenotrophomonas mori]
MWLAGMVLPAIAAAAALPPGWQVVATSQAEIDGRLPASLQVPLLARGGKPLPQVELLVALPFDRVLPAVQGALAPQGRFQAPVERTRVAYMAHGWGGVMMARRPELKAEYVQRADLPALERAVADGALLAEELPERLARLQRDPAYSAQSDTLAALRVPFASWSASDEQRHGVAGRSRSRIEVRVMQVDEAMGRPATVVNLRRVDEWPNPAGGVLQQLRALADFNILGSGPSARISRSRVPEPLFASLSAALRALPGADLQLGADARDWMPPAAPLAAIVEPVPVAPADEPGFAATRMLVIPRVLSEQTFDAAELLPLADGSVLLVQPRPFALLRWAAADGGTPRTVWRAPDPDVSRWQLAGDRDGKVAYLAMPGQVLRFEVEAAAPSVHPLHYDSPGVAGDAYLRFMHDGGGVPQAYRHDHQDGQQRFSLWSVARPVAGDGLPWHAGRRFSAPRQALMDAGFPGNTRMKPVQWDAPGAPFWVEDAAGLAELDGHSGRVVRTIPLPRRFGEADPHDAAGMAQWVPAPFASARGGWIAVGFVLMEDRQRTPGMHVVDVATGEVRRSPALPGLDALNAAAGSPDGRRLALAGNRGGVVAAVWDLETGQSQRLRVDHDRCWDLRRLAWSPDGAAVWGLCGDALVRWPLPASWP